MTGDYLSEDKDFKNTSKITWLADGTNLLIADLVEYDHLIKQKKVEEDVEFEDIVNTNSKFVAQYYVDSNIRTLNSNQFLQFQRKGYYKIDRVVKEGDDLKYTLIYTPDGKKVGLASQGNQTSEKSDIKKESLEEKKINKGKKKEEEIPKIEEATEGAEGKVEKVSKKKEKKEKKHNKPEQKKEGDTNNPQLEVQANSEAPKVETPTVTATQPVDTQKEEQTNTESQPNEEQNKQQPSA